MNITKNLYHYTSRLQAERIIKAGYLWLTPSDLIKPVDLTITKNEDGTWGTKSEISDRVKPVVWLTDSLNPNNIGLEGPDEFKVIDKKRIRITVMPNEEYSWWVTWAQKNRMNKKWFKAYTRNNRYGTWYISEKEIYMKDVLLIEDMVTGEILLDNRKVA